MSQPLTPYTPASDRYAGRHYRRAGASGLTLPPLSLGLWHNFGDDMPLARQREILRTAFDHGITHFDLANNYGAPYGSAERNLGQLLRQDFAPHRDELIISTKAGWDMWPGPYGQGGSSRKYLLASLDQSLQRLGLDYVDIFYSHRFDPDTPLEETADALASIVRQGKALYVGISSYSAAQAAQIAELLSARQVPLTLQQPVYNLLERDIESNGVLAEAAERGAGVVTYSPLAQGVLSGKYAQGVPADSRIGRGSKYLQHSALNEALQVRIADFEAVARKRGQSLSQLALAWALRDSRVTSVLVGVSSREQLLENLKALEQLGFTEEELGLLGSV
ncbi:L-glyceraldehyde 3-phosphate reductase [Pseudomonas putida]|uniref:L-glyceraldehyde 3-phosphate reductase n=1 Tax=Pseudomonas putida TaxID=303 RepID=A0A4D6XB79_PSEPU|nr:L-glyceraldehyde 3-phosphate reductase [Pseudomonas putida]